MRIPVALGRVRGWTQESRGNVACAVESACTDGLGSRRKTGVSLTLDERRSG